MDEKQAAKEGRFVTGERADFIAVSRFVSSLAGAFRSFFIYRLDNEALDEIVQNVVKRFQDAVPAGQQIRLGLSSRSISYEEQPVGFTEVTFHLAGQLFNLGFKEIVFTPPLQNRHFFQFFNILASKDPNENKMEKLIPFIGVEEKKPITLIPITANLLVVRLSDEIIQKHLEPLAESGILEEMAHCRFRCLPDVYTWLCVKVEMLPLEDRTFIRDFIDAAREGYFPAPRFVHLFPFPSPLKEDCLRWIASPAVMAQRRPSLLGQGFRKAPSKPSVLKVDWISQIVTFSEEDIRHRQDARFVSGQTLSTEDMDNIQVLVGSGGPNMILALRLLLRYLADNSTVAVQERALKMGIRLWLLSQGKEQDAVISSLLSALRQHLCSFTHINLTLFPLRSLTIESEAFTRISQYILTLGEAALPSLVNTLDNEQDRGMRRKLCHLITLVAREGGIDPLIEAIPKASHFLVRNIIMILGDVKNPKAVKAIGHLITHQQKIVRIEAIRSLCKMGTEEVSAELAAALQKPNDEDILGMALDYLVQKKDRRIVDRLITMAKQENISDAWKHKLYTSLGVLGGMRVREFFESLQKGAGLFGRFNTSQREEQELIKSILSGLNP
ncbi:MAG: HEAT repeat domain-containing protein [Elusimicrobia bacterium]|nr:HEAT repeat domain-containing protein [Candidatus Obscuribacterium magneticum]